MATNVEEVECRPMVSITEKIDYTTPQGKLFTQMIGSFAEYFSGALANHVSKGLE